MTIAASILCRDGIVLCADTETSITDDRKGTASKLNLVLYTSERGEGIEIFQKIEDSSRAEPWAARSHWSLGIAGAGHAEWIAAYIQGMSTSVLRNMFNKKLDLPKLKRYLEEYTEKYFQKYIRGYAEDPQQRPQAQMLVAVQPKSRWMGTMFRVNDNVLLQGDLDTHFAIGKGAPVFTSLADKLFHRADFNMKQAAAIAVYMLRRVALEVPGCGGNSHIVLMGRDGTTQTLTTKRIAELELYHRTIEPKFYESLAAEIVKELP